MTESKIQAWIDDQQMVDVEQAGSFARGVMLFDGSGRVLHRHLPAGEGDHTPALVYVPLV